MLRLLATKSEAAVAIPLESYFPCPYFVMSCARAEASGSETVD